MTETPRLQGGLSWDKRFSLSQSLSDDTGPQAGSLYAATPGVGNDYGTATKRSWTYGAEGVTLWRASLTDESLGSTARMWTVTEHADQRLVLGVYYSAVD